MNIFILHLNTKKCAKYHCNRHVVKMILELAQMLCTCLILLDPYVSEIYDLYKPTHVNHPCTKWIRESSENYRWTYSLFVELCREYTYRYGKIHLCQKKFIDIFNRIPINIHVGEMTSFAMAMPEQYKIKSKKYRQFGHLEILSYRKYYINDKKSFAKWTDNNGVNFVPNWFK